MIENLEPQTLFYIFGAIIVILLIIIVLAGIFSTLMLNDCLKSDLPKKNKWVALITVFNFIGALFYYFFVKKKDKLFKK
jgi:glucan phosphoethanolaminetransferase (alkaline phosphatase superfamily)